jgi:CDP-glucose 4,6-dehydratase
MRIDALAEAYRGKRVLLTGHTGFKGAWLAEWLLDLGAEVTGYSLPPPTAPALFGQLDLARRLRHREGDVRDAAKVRGVLGELQPDFVFHLAAQPLVRLSYAEPVETYAVNVMGTINVMEALRGLRKPCAAVMITTDKCYENREWLHGYREDDALGGYDPYSSSKAAAEIAIAAYRRSFFHPAALRRGDAGEPPVALASARAGNVIGGGDWALDRIVPDCMRALARGEVLAVRNPAATRPWQHVLEPLGGYLTLGAALHAALRERNPALDALAGPFNFGPDVDSNRPVHELVAEMLRHWPGRWEDKSDARALHEAGRLHLTTEKAYHLLGWRPRWRFAETIARTTRWYRGAHEDPANVPALTRADLAAYVATRP